ncbi:DUF1259 domain-containing protein [Streptomyces sp. AV19]|uniref:DUF1259 domain-containing protein n=1 Tax=Streptomyces sp. AV19 TaxID=2793068 RepID=UPI0018FEECA9|nr:DUF1259 domain-containing protein [Streptomyces sp. AV19]MBH1933333.1 DUF1259 domain-containing protein [Streptomyces sp. AV19]MDG4531944.1 DUF1259 domain-containing protein [Streptomyces sp. AV19]
MTGDRPQNGDGSPDRPARAATSRRLVLATAALAPMLAGTGTARAHDDGRRTTDPCHDRRLIHPVNTAESHWQGVTDVLSHKGRMGGDQVYRMGFLRHDLRVKSYGHSLAPSLGIGSFVSFVRYEDGRTMLMGDMAVTEGEMQRVIDVLDGHGIGQTAIHKHLLSHEPHVWWMHIHGLHRDELMLARALREALAVTGTPPSAGIPEPADVDLDTSGIDEALGTKGGTEGEIYKITFARRETIIDHDRVLPRMTGATTAISFQPVGRGRAIISGDFVMTGQEMQHVVRALRQGGVDIVSIHSHMLFEEPRLFFLHFWGIDDGVRLARALRAAVDHTNVSPAGANE